jgi:hypothetical protein
MLTGVTTAEMAESLPDTERPTAVAADANELRFHLEEMSAGRKP